jgi:hypothetical protein
VRLVLVDPGYAVLAKMSAADPARLLVIDGGFVVWRDHVKRVGGPAAERG